MTSLLRFIVIATTKTGDNSVVLHTLSAQWGRRSFITSARGCPRAFLLPLSILEAEVSENPRSDLWRMKNIVQVHPLPGIRADVMRGTVTLFMSEVLFRTLREGEGGGAPFYLWCEKSILTLDALDSSYANFHLRWLLELATALGFAPGPEDLAPFAGEHLGSLRELLRLDFAGCMMLPLSGASRNAIAEILIRYIGVHQECTICIRSLAVLRELYA